MQDDNKNNDVNYHDFLDWFEDRRTNKESIFYTIDITGRKSEIILHGATSSSIITKLRAASSYFNQIDSNSNTQYKELTEKDILEPGKLSVINVASDINFGSIILRHLLKRIVKAKDEGDDIPILIIIDEVHQFYKSNLSKDALGELDTICRVGRSKKIGIIFSSQNEDDLPKGVSNVVNTKLYFKTDNIKKNYFGVNQREIQSLKSGYGVGMIHGMPNLNVFKFPLSLSGIKK